MTVTTNEAVRHDFELWFDVQGGNPNGDPDNANQPRMDPETGELWVTDVALKRKVRDFIADAYNSKAGMGIFVANGTALNARMRETSEELGLPKGSKRKLEDVNKAAEHMAARFYDIRAFGAVMSTGDYPSGQLRGPIQIACPAVSVEPVFAADLTITRVTVTKEEELAKLGTDDGGKSTEMGGKHVVPYALFRARGSFTPSFARRTGFDSEDLQVFWDALARMWALDRSASRGTTGCRAIHVWSHDDAYGRAHAADLYDRVRVTRISELPARSFADYEILVDSENLPAGVTYTQLL